MAGPRDQTQSAAHAHAVADGDERLRVAMNQQIELVLDAKEGVAVDVTGIALSARQTAQMAHHAGHVAPGAEAPVAGAVQHHAHDGRIGCPSCELRQHQFAHLKIKRVQLPWPVQSGKTYAVPADSGLSAKQDG